MEPRMRRGLPATEVENGDEHDRDAGEPESEPGERTCRTRGTAGCGFCVHAQRSSSRSPQAIRGPGGPAPGPVSGFECWWTTSESGWARSNEATSTWSDARPAALAS